MRRRPLIGILPHRQLDLEKVQAHGTECDHAGAIGPAQDQQIVIAFQVVAEGQPEPSCPPVLPCSLSATAIVGATRGERGASLDLR